VSYRQGTSAEFNSKAGRLGPTVSVMTRPAFMVQRLCELADMLGYKIRMEMLDGPGGICEIKGDKFLFVSTALDLTEQAEQLAQALCNEPGLDDHYVLPDVREFLLQVKSESHL